MMFKKLRNILYRSVENNEISYKNLIQGMKNKNIILIDVRSSQEYEEGHLNGAVNIPLYNLEEKVENIIKEKNALIVVYCSSGYRSKKAKEILEKLNYINVYNLKDGLDNVWIQ